VHCDTHNMCNVVTTRKMHYLATLATINKEKDYIAQYILYLEEASLFWKKMPRHT